MARDDVGVTQGLVATAGWAVVVPVKHRAAAKSRLRGGLPGVPHEELVTALVLDTLAAARRCAVVAQVVVVGADPGLAKLDKPGVRLLPEPESGGLNGALGYAAAQLSGAGVAELLGVAALLGDLPALDPAELAEALEQASGLALERAGTRAFVADAAGTGTTLLAAPAGTPLAPHFGSGSAGAHLASGAVALTGAWPTLRRDVDTPADLAAAAALGLGAHTAALLAGAG